MDRDGMDACARPATLVSRLGALRGQPRSERVQIVRRVLSGLWLRCAEARGNGCVRTRLRKRTKTQPVPRRPAGQAARRLTAAASATVRVWSLVRGPAKALRQGSTAFIFWVSALAAAGRGPRRGDPRVADRAGLTLSPNQPNRARVRVAARAWREPTHPPKERGRNYRSKAVPPPARRGPVSATTSVRWPPLRWRGKDISWN